MGIAFKGTNEELLQILKDRIQVLSLQTGRLYADLGITPIACDCQAGVPWIDFEYVPLKPAHLNLYDGVHGGFIASVIDTCAGYGCAALVEWQTLTTLDMNVHYMQALMGDRYILHTEYPHMGRRSATVLVSMLDPETGRVMDTGTVTYAIVPSLADKRKF